MWKYRVSFRNMINVTFVTGRRVRERRGEGEGEGEVREGGEGGEETTYRDSRFMFMYMCIYRSVRGTSL